MLKMWNSLKLKWNVDSDLRLGWIFIIFAITGSSIVFVRQPIQVYLYDEANFWDLIWYQKLVITLVVYFVYQIHLFVIGSILGEHKFVKWFILKMNKRMFGRLIKKQGNE